jgi:hypothetical protein
MPIRLLVLSQKKLVLSWEYTPLAPANITDPNVKAVDVPVPPNPTPIPVPCHVPVPIVPSVVIEDCPT